MLGRRLHVLLDDGRFERLHRLAGERGVSVGSLVRHALDVAYPVDGQRRSAAAAAILDAPAAPSPKLDDLRAELAELRETSAPDPAPPPAAAVRPARAARSAPGSRRPTRSSGSGRDAR